jgi:chromosome partitioning protein
MIVRKLLVASQKGGVGKTTTSVNLAAAAATAGPRVLLLEADPLGSVSTSLNLAEHPRRRALRACGADLPGVLVREVVPGLDVLCPYDDGGCLDDDFDHLLRALAEPGLRDCYGCLVVNAPPFLGANPGQLLRACDELVLVMRAEPMAARTLPAFLELVQRACRGGEVVPMRGIVLTLPEGENPGARWERELRGRFGNRILPQVIPFDEEVPKAQVMHQIPAHASRQSPASRQYHHLAETLGLARAGRSGRADVTAVLRAAVAGTKRAAAPAPRPEPEPALVAAAVAAEEGPALREVDAAPAFLAGPSEGPLVGGVPSRQWAVPDPPPPPRAPSGRTPVRAPAPATATSLPAVREPAAPAEGLSMATALLCVGVAVVLGVALRFVHLPDYLLPVLVGVAVAAVAVGLLRYLWLRHADGGRPSSTRPVRSGWTREVKRLPSRPSDPGLRLSGLRRREK